MTVASIAAAWKALVWFMFQTVVVGGFGLVFFLVPFALLVGGMIVGFPRGNKRSWLGLGALIMGLPTIWLFVGFWGGLFWYDWQQHGPRNPAWVQYPVTAAPWIGLAAMSFFIWRLKGARLFATSYSLINLYFILSMCLLASMAISGGWL